MDFGKLMLMEAEYTDAKQHLIDGVLASMIKKKDWLISQADTLQGNDKKRTLENATKLDHQIQIIAAYSELVEELMGEAFGMAKNEFNRGYARGKEDAAAPNLPIWFRGTDKETLRDKTKFIARSKWADLY